MINTWERIEKKLRNTWEKVEKKSSKNGIYWEKSHRIILAEK